MVQVLCMRASHLRCPREQSRQGARGKSDLPTFWLVPLEGTQGEQIGESARPCYAARFQHTWLNLLFLLVRLLFHFPCSSSDSYCCSSTCSSTLLFLPILLYVRILSKHGTCITALTSCCVTCPADSCSLHCVAAASSSQLPVQISPGVLRSASADHPGRRE